MINTQINPIELFANLEYLCIFPSPLLFLLLNISVKGGRMSDLLGSAWHHTGILQSETGKGGGRKG